MEGKSVVLISYIYILNILPLILPLREMSNRNISWEEKVAVA
jgi:hypothetical protein